MISCASILVAVEFSAASDKALLYGRELARLMCAKLHVIHVVSDMIAAGLVTHHDTNGISGAEPTKTSSTAHASACGPSSMTSPTWMRRRPSWCEWEEVRPPRSWTTSRNSRLVSWSSDPTDRAPLHTCCLATSLKRSCDQRRVRSSPSARGSAISFNPRHSRRPLGITDPRSGGAVTAPRKDDGAGHQTDRADDWWNRKRLGLVLRQTQRAHFRYFGLPSPRDAAVRHTHEADDDQQDADDSVHVPPFLVFRYRIRGREGKRRTLTYQALRVGGRFGARSIDDSATPFTELLNPPLAPPVPEASRTGAGSVTALAEGCGPSPPPSPVDGRDVGCTFWAFLWILLPPFLLFCVMFFMDPSGAPHDETSKPAASSSLHTRFRADQADRSRSRCTALLCCGSLLQIDCHARLGMAVAHFLRWRLGPL